MTDREKAIVMARTGICMLEGEKFDLFYQYLAELFGRPVYTHELLTLQSEIEKRSDADFIKICRDEQPEQWIPVTELLPNAQEEVIVSCIDDSGDTKHRYTASGWVTTDGEYWIVDNEINPFVVAWMYMPEPYGGREAMESCWEGNSVKKKEA